MIEARHARTPSGSGPITAQASRSVSSSSAAMATAPATPMTRLASLSAGSHDERRPSFLDVSALSSAEHVQFLKWLATIKPSPSGEPEHIDEQDALRFLRQECGIEMRDEIKILSLFDRFPLGLLPGHFFALLRLAAWVQRGEEPTKTAIFTQANPPKVGLSAKGIQPPPQHVSVSAPAPLSPPVRRQSLKVSPPRHQQEEEQQQQQPASSRSAALASALEMAPSAPEPSRKALQAPLVPIAAPSTSQPALPSRPPPVPDDSTKPSNPFRVSSQAQPPAIALAGTSPSSNAMLGSAILGFDPAPNPFKQSKPKLVRPTPIVANASTQVLGRPSAAVNPFKSGASISSSQGSPVSTRSLNNNNDLPALPPRSTTAADLRPPPPLPPRHISPLIQAGLNARSEVRKKKEALPPKTFTVLQSSGSRHHNEPRLLTGQTAQNAPPPPPLPNKRRSGGTEHRRSVTDVPPPSAYKAAPSGASVASSDRQEKEKRPASGGTARTDAASRPILVEVPSKRAGPLPQTVAPKPSYGGAKGKTGLPAWLQEQEELQRGSLHEPPTVTPQVPAASAGGSEGTKSKKKHRRAASSQRIQFLDNDSDSDSDEISEQARSAASIDRNNPFFPPHARDIERGVDLSEPLSKLAVANAVAAAVRDGPDGQDSSRPLGRSKTLRDTYRGGAVAPPPAPPPRRRLDSLPGPATFNAGTYPGFGKSVRVDGPTVGGLRQNPQSKKAEVGIPPEILAEREKAAADKHRTDDGLGQRTSSAPLPPPRRQPSSVSAESESSAAITTPISQWPGPVVGSRSASFSQRMGEILKLSGNGEDGGAASSTKLNSLRNDFNSVAERHEWLARATERAKGRPLNEARVGLMNDEDRDDDEDYHDAPDVDGIGLQADQRRASMTTPRAGAAGSTMRRAPSIGSRSARNSLGRRTSLLSRPSFGPFGDEEGDGSALVVDEQQEEEEEDDEDEFTEDEEDVGPDVDTHSGSSNTKVRESLEQETRRRRRSSSSTRANNRVASGDKHTDMAKTAAGEGGWQQLS